MVLDMKLLLTRLPGDPLRDHADEHRKVVQVVFDNPARSSRSKVCPMVSGAGRFNSELCSQRRLGLDPENATTQGLELLLDYCPTQGA